MMLLNELTFAGNAGADAVDGTTTKGVRVVTFSLAHNEKDKEGNITNTTWIRVKTFGAWCDLAASVKKGDNMIVRGKLNVSTWEGKDGGQRTSVDVIPYSLGRIAKEPRNIERQETVRPEAAKPEKRSAPRPHHAPPARRDEPTYDEDNLPF